MSQTHQKSNSAEAQQEQLPGYRLETFDFLNWGTFDQHSYHVKLQGSTGTIIGDNGAGKTTITDALLMLFCPPGKRIFNQAAGIEHSTDRDERSYIQGAWNKYKNEGEQEEKTSYLREKGTYTVLLGVFHNRCSKQSISVAQVLWIQQEKVRALYIVAAFVLTLADHLTITSDLATFRRNLKYQEIPHYPTFDSYIHAFRHLAGLRSEKAFDLFNQAVSNKHLGHLTNFIRAHMLEQTNVEQRLLTFQEHFTHLTRAYTEMTKAEQLAATLEPVIEAATAYRHAETQQQHYHHCLHALSRSCAALKQKLLEQSHTRVQQQLHSQQQKKESLKEQLAQLKEEQRERYLCLNHGPEEERFLLLSHEIQSLEQQKHYKQHTAQQYQATAQFLNLPSLPEQEQIFFQNQTQAQNLIDDATQHLLQLQTALSQQSIVAHTWQEQHDELEKERHSLQQRSSNLPSSQVALRHRITQALSLAEEALPYVAELLQIHDQVWAPAIERLLFSFGLCLLVPAPSYTDVNRYLHTTQLGTRLIYYRIDLTCSPASSPPCSPEMLPAKVEVKPDTIFTPWLQRELLTRFSYRCCTTVQEFGQYPQTLTSTGLMKHSVIRHEKDDRSKREHDTAIFGWTNKQKRTEIETRSAEASEHARESLQKLHRLQQEQQEQETKNQHAHTLLAYDLFTMIDWQTDQRLLREKQQEHNTLQLQIQHKRTERLQRYQEEEHHLQQLEAEKERISALITLLEKEDEETNQSLKDCETILQTTSEVLPEIWAQIQTDLGVPPLTIEALNKQEAHLDKHYTSELTRLQTTLTKEAQHLQHLMHTVREQDHDVSVNMDEALEALPDYQALYKRICFDDLPSCRKQFKALLDEAVIQHVSVFKHTLEHELFEIKERIRHMNTSLYPIPYTASTFIELDCEEANDIEVNDFRHALRACLPDVAFTDNAETNTACFLQIEQLLTRLAQSPMWTRKVTDVRNWLTFAARERERESEACKRYYSDSSGMSAGQKTKLAYTILASAIAYQYRLYEEKERSFRFVAVDEAFCRSDEANARYMMELFRQLDLQVLVVTPNDKIPIIEPYITSVHLITNTAAGNHSNIHTMTIEEYQEKSVRPE